MANAPSTPAPPHYQYTRVFRPTGADGTEARAAPAPDGAAVGDRSDGSEYVYSEDIILAVNLAISTGRPLLVSGPPGSGKSSLARSIAHWQEWRFYEQVVTSRTQARDLLWRFDTLRRLADAQVAEADKAARARLEQPSSYVEPGVLWWAMDPASAARRGAATLDGALGAVEDPNEGVPAARAVVLIDEIDKADPDVPNDLLVPLGSYRFQVEELRAPVALATDNPAPVLVITTNGEREMPNAFVRRCLTLRLPGPEVEWLVTVATRRFGPDLAALARPIAEQTVQVAGDAQRNQQVPPGTAEFLDAVRACRTLGVAPSASDPTWEAIKLATLWKGRAPQDSGAA